MLTPVTLPKDMFMNMVLVSENHSHVPVSMIEKITMHLLLYPTLNFQNGFFFYIYNLSSQIDY